MTESKKPAELKTDDRDQAVGGVVLRDVREGTDAKEESQNATAEVPTAKAS